MRTCAKAYKGREEDAEVAPVSCQQAEDEGTEERACSKDGDTGRLLCVDDFALLMDIIGTRRDEQEGI